MGDLTTFNEGPITTAIYDLYKKRGDAEKPRAYLGGSAIGDECSRKLWYGFRWATAPQWSGRMYRLFQTGHLAEPRFFKDLRDIGVEVWERDPKTGRQFAYSDVFGHFRGNTDGMARRVPGGGARDHLLECKTHANKSFVELARDGVVKAKPQHWIQMNTYMGWTGYERALYAAVNKDTDELYFERVRFDPMVFAKTQAKAEAIIFAVEPPPRLSDDPAFYKCKQCDHSAVCHGTNVPRKSCRTCVHATPTKIGDGSWHCARYDIHPTHDQQLTGCMAHLPLPFLLQYATPEDAGEDWILFRHTRTNSQFVVGSMPPAELVDLPLYTSEEIAIAPGSAITNPDIYDLMAAFDAKFQ
jgi:hypothetical protein